ncbi:MAG: type I DNA topoisomerase [Candidatus Omnitrophica bacterium]|nr:type I DNA topoisomerase [Candidatus Omnitrophota bacterium]
MSKYLVIVESPTKAKTISAILGDDYEVTSSMGHVVDLPANKLSIDIENGFAPNYRVIPGKEKIITQLKSKAKGKETIYIATDPDREGEAIGWHIQDKLAKEKRVFYRVVFHEITADALHEAFAHPTQLDMDKINSQIARRVLDRVVGYTLSPLLWKKVVRGLSAGRVQSVALRFIVEREKEIMAFIPKTTYSIEAQLNIDGVILEAKLEKYKGKKAIFDTKEEALRCIEEIKKESLTVRDIITKTTKRNPPPPYTTSLLQQDAFNKLHFSSQRTMLLAQKLYEGTEVKGAMVGLITYMRTDSFNISAKAKHEAKEFIHTAFGKEYLPEREYRHKEKKGAQLAHEAIRPTSILRSPEEVRNFVSPEEAMLYELIWRRFTASSMKEALFENTKIIFESPNTQFSAVGMRTIFDGFLKVWGKEENETALPPLKNGQGAGFKDLMTSEHTTKPPARFNDASLVKLMEEKGIGRPSTYAPTIYTLISRNYIRREKAAFVPTDLGIRVSDLLSKYFSEVMNENFTADMEEKLDEVEEGRLVWTKVLEDFYPAFKEKVEKAGSVIKKEVEVSDKKCPKCGTQLVFKWSRKGRFLSCGDFPKCRYAESITTEVACPLCKVGKLLERRNKRGQVFYGCTKFPECRYTARTLPSDTAATPDTQKEPGT